MPPRLPSTRRGRALAVAAVLAVALPAGSLAWRGSGDDMKLEAGRPGGAAGDSPEPAGVSSPETTTAAADAPAQSATGATGTTGTTGAPPSLCATSDLAVAVATDRQSYSPGDVVKVTVTATNGSRATCWVADDSPYTGQCDPHMVVHRWDDEDDSNTLLGPFFPSGCTPTRHVLAPRQGVSHVVEAPFPELYGCVDDTAGAGACEGPRAGTWTVYVTWDTTGDAGDSVEPPLGAMTDFQCPSCVPAPTIESPAPDGPPPGSGPPGPGRQPPYVLSATSGAAGTPVSASGEGCVEDNPPEEDYLYFVWLRFLTPDGDELSGRVAGVSPDGSWTVEWEMPQEMPSRFLIAPVCQHGDAAWDVTRTVFEYRPQEFAYSE